MDLHDSSWLVIMNHHDESWLIMMNRHDGSWWIMMNPNDSLWWIVMISHGEPSWWCSVLRWSGDPVSCGLIGILQKSPVQNLTSELRFDRFCSQPLGDSCTRTSHNAVQGFHMPSCAYIWYIYRPVAMPTTSENGENLLTAFLHPIFNIWVCVSMV